MVLNQVCIIPFVGTTLNDFGFWVDTELVGKIEIFDALARTTDFPTISGKLNKFSFAPNRDALYDQIIMVVKDGELQFFE